MPDLGTFALKDTAQILLLLTSEKKNPSTLKGIFKGVMCISMSGTGLPCNLLTSGLAETHLFRSHEDGMGHVDVWMALPPSLFSPAGVQSSRWSKDTLNGLGIKKKKSICCIVLLIKQHMMFFVFVITPNMALYINST